eukprot:gene12813-15036_t
MVFKDLSFSNSMLRRAPIDPTYDLHRLSLDEINAIGTMFYIYDARVNMTNVVFFNNIYNILLFLDTFERNYSPATSFLGSTSKSLSIESTVFRGHTKGAIMVSLYENAILIFQDCSFKDINGNIIASDSNSMIAIVNTEFNGLNGRIIESYARGEIILANVKIRNVTSADDIIKLSNKVTCLSYGLDISNCNVSKIFSISYNSKLVLLQASIYQNIVTNSIIMAYNNFILGIDHSCFRNNTGIFVRIKPSSGSISVSQSQFNGNYSPYGTFIYFTDPVAAEAESTCLQSHYENNSYFSNKAIKAGVLAYHESSVICPFDMDTMCIDCYQDNNHAKFGGLVDTFYWNFTVLMPQTIMSPEVLQVVIEAKGYYGDLVKGRSSDVTFVLIPPRHCEMFHLSGITSTTLNNAGLPRMYNLELSGFPGTSCELTFTSIPPPRTQNVNVTVTFHNCTKGTYPYEDKEIYHCLHRREVPKIMRYILCVFAVILAIPAVFCFILWGTFI